MKLNCLVTYQRVSKYVIEVLTVTLFIIVIFFQSLNILFRYAKIADSIVWVEEFTRFSFIWIAFLLWPLADRNGSHFTVDLFLNKLTSGKRVYLEILIDLLAIGFVVLVIWASYRYIPVAMLYHTNSITWLRMGIVYLVIPLGLTLVFIERVLMLYNRVRLLRRKDFEEYK